MTQQKSLLPVAGSSLLNRSGNTRSFLLCSVRAGRPTQHLYRRFCTVWSFLCIVDFIRRRPGGHACKPAQPLQMKFRTNPNIQVCVCVCVWGEKVLWKIEGSTRRRAARLLFCLSPSRFSRRTYARACGLFCRLVTGIWTDAGAVCKLESREGARTPNPRRRGSE